MMTTQDIIIEHLNDQKWEEREAVQQVIQEMLIDCLRESNSLDIYLKYEKSPIVQENAGEHILHGITDAGSKTKSIITRLRALCRRNKVIIKALLNHASDVIGGTKGRFRKSGSKKSASQIAKENLRKKLDPDKKLAESEARVKVPYTGKGIKQTDIALINSSILIKSFDDDNNFEIDTFGINYVKNDRGKRRAISDKGEGIKGFESLMLYTNSMIYFIKHREKLDTLGELIIEGFKIINNDDNNSSTEYSNKVHKLIKDANMKLNVVGNGGIKLTMPELKQFQQKLNDLSEKLDFVQNGNTKIDNVDKSVIQSLNDLVHMMEIIQLGLNSLTNAIQKVHLIDLKFMNSISDRDALSKFAYDCIVNGIPPKFIAYNAWLISSENLRGSSPKYKPVGGQTRCVFFPNDNKNEILKIATSGLGITSNKNEIRFSDFIKKSNEQDMIDISALVTNSYAENAILSMERIVDRVGKHPDLQTLMSVKSKFRDFTKRHPELRLNVSDFNDGNVMWSSDRNKWVCIDYGLGQRNSSKQDKLDRIAKKQIDKYSDKTNKNDIVDVTEK
jgi:hypothetical protein